MTEGVAPSVARSLPSPPPRVRRAIALTLATVTLIACTVAAALLLSRAVEDGRAISNHALDAAKVLSLAFDQEVAGVNYLLKGLSSSPALKSGDVKGFYDQLKATPLPDGAWLILQDLDGQVVNTLQPFGATLPRHRDFPSYPEALNRVRERGWIVSGRMESRVKAGTTIIALSLRIDHDDGTMKGFITTILPEDRLGTILGHQEIPEGWTKGLYDRKFQPIVTTKSVEASSRIPAPAALAARVADAGPDSTIEGKIEATDERGQPVLIAFRRSGTTNWTTAVTVSRADLDAPINAALWRMAGPAALLLFAGGLATWFTARQVERPLRTLSDLIAGANNQVSELTGRLLALQEEERQRIARELHDSTAQHLVAANLGLAGLEAEVRQSPEGRKALAKVEGLLAEALRELRIFTYLLHPPNLANDGLQATLRDFAEGFADRTGLLARIRIPEEVDDLPPDLQRAILRVVQEALTNVHRHAGASTVSVNARILSGWLVVCIRDNGRGMVAQDRAEERVRLGVGVAGMRARLEQFGGGLRIRSGPGGTCVVAMTPVPGATGRAPSRTGRLRMLGPAATSKVDRKAFP